METSKNFQPPAPPEIKVDASELNDEDLDQVSGGKASLVKERPSLGGPEDPQDDQQGRLGKFA